MEELDRDVAARVAELAADRSSGAAELIERAMRLVGDVRRARRPIAPLASALVAAQPSMAPFWMLAAEALAADGDPVRWDRFVARRERAPRALLRVAAAHLSPADGRTLRLVTLSASGTVRGVVEALACNHRVHVSCTESRPALEGRMLATHLAAAGVPVTTFSDAAIGHALVDADAVVVGADAVAPTWILNKCGTLMLAAAATHRGVPVYVLATRDKVVPDAIARRLVVREERGDEVWADAPALIDVRNPYFEHVPADLIAAVISDLGVLGTGVLPDVCAAAIDDAAVQMLLQVLGG